MDAFKGRFERASADQYEQFLKALEVNILLREAATVSTPVCKISKEGGVWTIKSSTTLKTTQLKFKLNEEFDETTPDGRDMKVLATLEEGRIVMVQKVKNEMHKSTKSIRKMNGSDEFVYITTVNGVDGLVCVQKFKRVEGLEGPEGSEGHRFSSNRPQSMQPFLAPSPIVPSQ